MLLNNFPIDYQCLLLKLQQIYFLTLSVCPFGSITSKKMKSFLKFDMICLTPGIKYNSCRRFTMNPINIIEESCCLTNEQQFFVFLNSVIRSISKKDIIQYGKDSNNIVLWICHSDKCIYYSIFMKITQFIKKKHSVIIFIYQFSSSHFIQNKVYTVTFSLQLVYFSENDHRQPEFSQPETPCFCV